ncbi:branched-chain amino acid ABC transporter permease [Acuticoccus sediminis]|uniref:branched-chain amino acid ABC transporter permease n=1 Tax=Acuticoccus sediminis TaxID=2184697 RepID=UPI001CFEB088|nr:branched-chain amino acid ABC transporter permease [Acuticoccus sediminis]
MMLFLQFLVSGFVTGCFLILATIGFSLTRRVEGFLNIAHAELIGVGAFTCWGLNALLGVHVVVAAVVAIVVTAFLGLFVGRLVYDPIRRFGPAVLLITSVGVAYVIGGTLDGVIGTGIRTLDIPLATTYRIHGLRITDYQLVMVALAALSAIALAVFLNATKVGLAVRAMADNPGLAASRGIDVATTSRITWLLASGLAGLAGVMLAVTATLSTDIAFHQILQILAVAILAGLGSLYAVIWSGLIVGICMDVSVYWIPAGYRPLIAFAVVILVLLVRPQGLAGARAS